jgi:hypothetical protein
VVSSLKVIRRGDTFHMHRLGDDVAKVVKEIKRKREKKKEKKKGLGCPSPFVSPTSGDILRPNNSHNGPSLSRPSSCSRRRRSAGLEAGVVGHSVAPISLTRPPASRTRLRRLLPCFRSSLFLSLPSHPLSVPVDSAAAVVPGALRWGRRRTWGCGWWSREERGGGGEWR